MDMAVDTEDMVMAVMVDTVLDMVVIIVASDLLMPKLNHGTAMADTDTAVDTADMVMAVMVETVDMADTGVRPHTPK